MKPIKVICILFLISSLLYSQSSTCIECHYKITPKIVSDWELSKHKENQIECNNCHGDDHNTMEDYAKAVTPTPSTCALCHDKQVDQYKKGKHAAAWAAMNAMPTAHMQPMAMMDGQKGCGGCHKIGLKEESEIKRLKNEGSTFGHASCDACHTRHTFSKKEAQQPQACQTCHMGFDHPQWEMYSSSKHGVRYLLKQNKTLPETTAAPTCQTCHMSNGNHEVKTAWGFLAVRLPMPEDKQWANDRATILKALGVLDPKGNPTKLLETVKAANVARLTEEDWQNERNKMISVCSECHSDNFAKTELTKADEMIRRADRLMAQAIETVADLYDRKIIEKPKNYEFAYPNVLTFHDAPKQIEQKLFVMFLEYRMRTFQGAFHMNPDYSFWYGWSSMQMALTEIKEKDEEMKRSAKK